MAINKRNAGEWDIPIERECQNCGKKFLTVNRGRAFCNEVCSEAYRINHAECPVCHTRLIEKGIETGKGYCSEKCREEARLQRAIQDGNYIPCKQCGKNFIRVRLSNEFCCKECYETYREVHIMAMIQPRGKAEVMKKICPVCKKGFSVTPFQTTKLYCSVECRTRAQAARKPSAEKSETHLCTTCRVLQKNCMRFSSGFKKLPEGAEMQMVNGKDVVVKCPKYR